LEERGLAGAGDDARRQVADRRPRVVELRGVENVESFGSELQSHSFILTEVEALEYREIELLGARSVELVSSGVAEVVLARRDEGAGIEPAVDGGIRKHAGGNAIRPLHEGA